MVSLADAAVEPKNKRRFMRIEVTIPDGICGDWRVESFEVTREDSDFSKIRAIQHPEEYVEPGHYKKLCRNGTIIMSNTLMEIQTHRAFIWHAKGNVLINGLGLGVCLKAVLAKPQVRQVTVIEISSEVLRLVSPHFIDSRLTIIEADAFAWPPPQGVRYDAVWHDIWTDMCADNLPEMTKLKRKYGRCCDWQGCWAENIIRSRNRY